MEQGKLTLDEYEMWCEEQEVKPYKQLIDFWVALSNAVIIVGRLVREA